MSTFKGICQEVPQIRIDYFRASPDALPPLACFLSHAHSDHLQGLESFRSPFIYCSAATRELVLGLEKYPHRINFAKGILETRKQTYGHLKKLLIAIPLETPTDIELTPERTIRVTLFDANHCVGAVMFLIQSGGQAILYTGDIRSEPWWVNSLIRHPILIPYATGVEKLNTIYLDTTFASKQQPYHHFPSKAAGIQEMLDKVHKFPKHSTVFYFDAWTFGYEECWMALSGALQSRVHLDDYRLRLYNATKVPSLVGFQCGNREQAGCLTSDQDTPRIHSCERGTECIVYRPHVDFVRITPIVSRHDGYEIPELGVGGGQSDLSHTCEFDINDSASFGQLVALCASKLNNEPQLLTNIVKHLTAIAEDGHTIQLQLPGPSAGDHITDSDASAPFPLDLIVEALVKAVQEHPQLSKPTETESLRKDGLPRVILPAEHEDVARFGRPWKNPELAEPIAHGVKRRRSLSRSDGGSHYRPRAPIPSEGSVQRNDFHHRPARVIPQPVRAETRRPHDYGRLSPVQFPRQQRAESRRPHDYGRLSPVQFSRQPSVGQSRRPHASSMREPSTNEQANKLSKDASISLARRQQAYDAARGRDGRDWSDVGLTSVRGHHHAKEEEL
ncbi:hypothetical protein LTR66_006376 [Elasticomyces elasticus]|nr:hypothetical protein LTR66_006376 [Elasticomyces elasticus]